MKRRGEQEPALAQAARQASQAREGPEEATVRHNGG